MLFRTKSFRAHTIFVINAFILYLYHIFSTMKRQAVYFIFLCSFLFGFSQNNLKWQGYFSYNQVNAITETSNSFFAASENA